MSRMWTSTPRSRPTPRLELEIDNWRWAGVPFFLRTGKHLSGRVTEIAIRFKPAPLSLFQDTPVDALKPNWLVIRIAPDEGISLQFEVKRRGPVVDLAAVKMDFNYNDWFEKQANVGYETLLYDVMIGDPALFMRADTVEHGWRIVQPVLDAWEKDSTRFPNYASGSEGPKAADELIAKEKRPAVAADHRPVAAARMTSTRRHPPAAQRCGRHAGHQGQGADRCCRKRRRGRCEMRGIDFALTSSRPPRGVCGCWSSRSASPRPWPASTAARSPIRRILSIIESHPCRSEGRRLGRGVPDRTRSGRLGLYRG